METIIETLGESIVKDEIYSKYIYIQIYSIFSEILRFFKVEATFPYRGNAFSNNPSSGQLKQIFCLVETVLFYQSYFSASGSHYWNQRGKQSPKKELIIASGQQIFWLLKTIPFSIFQTPASDSFFPSGGKDVLRKSFIPASGN